MNKKLIDEFSKALKEIGGWGSIEVYVQNGRVTQITKRAIKKTNHKIEVQPGQNFSQKA